MTQRGDHELAMDILHQDILERYLGRTEAPVELLATGSSHISRGYQGELIFATRPTHLLIFS